MTVRHHPDNSDFSYANVRQQVATLVADLTPHPIRNYVAPIHSGFGIYVEEEALVKQAISKRRSEFAAGRFAARHCLAALGLSSQPLLRGSLGAPQWPEGVLGSITHDGGYAIAVATDYPGILGLGIDLVDQSRRAKNLPANMIVNSLDSEAIRQYLWSSRRQSVDPLLLAFSLKESAVKALSEKLNQFIDLLDISLHYKNGCLTASHSNDTHSVTLSAIWDAHHILTMGLIHGDLQ